MLGPLLLIVLGILFLLNNVYPETFRFSRMWPVILIVIGLAKVLDYFHGGQKKPDSQKEDQ
jgi:cell wall-active antibiotic response 4TMS protein YvqF